MGKLQDGNHHYTGRHINVRLLEGLEEIGIKQEHIEAIVSDVIPSDWRTGPPWRNRKVFSLCLKRSWCGHKLAIAVKEVTPGNYDVIVATQEAINSLGLESLVDGDELVLKKNDGSNGVVGAGVR